MLYYILIEKVETSVINLYFKLYIWKMEMSMRLSCQIL